MLLSGPDQARPQPCPRGQINNSQWPPSHGCVPEEWPRLVLWVHSSHQLLHPGCSNQLITLRQTEVVSQTLTPTLVLTRGSPILFRATKNIQVPSLLCSWEGHMTRFCPTDTGKSPQRSVPSSIKKANAFAPSFFTAHPLPLPFFGLEFGCEAWRRSNHIAAPR